MSEDRNAAGLTSSRNIQKAALDYMRRGWTPIPLCPRDKKPVHGDWPNLRVTAANLSQHFSDGRNLGVVTGDPSAGLDDVDLDAAEALRLADEFLLPTEAVFGRVSKRASHRLYRVATPSVRTHQFRDPGDGTMLVELRGTGGQTMFPPSVHPSGEAVEWQTRGEPALVTSEELLAKCGKLAAAALLVRHWPAQGSRHRVSLALAGVLLRAGWDPNELERFILSVACAAGDEEAADRPDSVRTTVQRLATGQNATGGPTATEIFGEAVWSQVVTWLKLSNSTAESGSVTVGPYRAKRDGIYSLKKVKNVLVEIPLTNFVARIVSDIRRDDGAETTQEFEVEATINGQSRKVIIAASQFGSMNWVAEKLGARAIISAGMGAKDKVREAIQLLSTDSTERTIYTHTGWRKIGGAWVYLHGGGAVGADGPVEGVETSLPDAAAALILPEPLSGAEIVDTIRASLRTLELGPHRITAPVFGAVWRAVLGGSDFSVFEFGGTGQFKTELAALAQQHYGRGFDSGHLPGSWDHTANSNEALAFTLKDAVFVVDDFKPGGTAADRQRLNRDAERLLRAQANRSGRGRMKSDTSLRQPKPPRGLIVSTGEELPASQSLRPRICIIEVAPGEIDPDKLTACQRDAAVGLYAQAMAGFIRWLAPRLDEIRAGLKTYYLRYRGLAAKSYLHRRTPGIVADLFIGWEWFLKFAKEAGAVTLSDAETYRELVWRALGEVANAQGEHQHQADPVNLFLELLGSAIASGHAHVANRDGCQPEGAEAAWGWRQRDMGGWQPFGDRVGWVEGDALYLDPNASYKGAQTMAGDDTRIPISAQTLRKRLHEAGKLARIDERRKTLLVRRTIEGRKDRPVLHLKADVLLALPAELPAEPDAPKSHPSESQKRRVFEDEAVGERQASAENPTL